MIRLSGAEWVPTAHTGGKIVPTLAVVHDTGSRITKGNVVNYLKRNKRKVSYTAVIERDGTVVQMASLDTRCNHAGRSEWKGRKWCNGFSIGIGLVNPGMMEGTAIKAHAWFGKHVRKNGVLKFFPKTFTSDDGLTAATSSYHGRGGVWLNYTPAQIASLTRVIAEIKEHYPDIEVTGHYNASPGRKYDPAPSPVIDLPAIELGGLENVGESLDAALGCEPGALVGREVSHAADTRIVTRSTDQVLRKESTEYRAAGFLKKTAAAPVVGIGMMEAASYANIAGAKSYLDLMSGLLKTYGFGIAVFACCAAMMVGAYIQHKKRISYDSGRYEPSGEMES